MSDSHRARPDPVSTVVIGQCFTDVCIMPNRDVTGVKRNEGDKADLQDEMMNVAGLIKAADTPNENFELVLTKWEHYVQLQYE